MVSQRQALQQLLSGGNGSPARPLYGLPPSDWMVLQHVCFAEDVANTSYSSWAAFTEQIQHSINGHRDSPAPRPIKAVAAASTTGEPVVGIPPLARGSFRGGACFDASPVLSFASETISCPPGGCEYIRTNLRETRDTGKRCVELARR